MNHSMDFKSNHSDYNNHLGENNVFYSNINQTNCSTTFSRPEIVNTDQNSFADIKPIAGLDSNLNSQMNNKNNFTLENTIINGNHEQHQLEQENELTKTNQNSNLFNEDDINESILMAVSKMNLCDIPIKRQIFEELLKNESNVQNRFKLFIKIENNLTLFPLEQEKLDELVAACQLLKNPYKHIVKKTNHLSDGIQITEAAICRLIKMSNKLKSFNRLDQKDKIALLKNSIIEMFCIRTTINYNCENNSWYFVDDKNKGLSLVSMEVLKAAKINYLSHKNFAIKYNSQFINDSKICDLVIGLEILLRKFFF